MCPTCGYSHGAYASCHETQERNWRADRAAEAWMYEAEPKPAPTPVEPSDERAERAELPS
jgi:hypothetical protein